MRRWLRRLRLIAWHGVKWRRTLQQIDALPEAPHPEPADKQP